jgi:hypothetical protein
MLRDDFIESDEWQAIMRRLLDWQTNAIVSMRNAGDFATSRYFAGQLDSIDYMLELPEKLLSNGEDAAPTNEGVRELPNHPRPTKTLF